nr:PRC-barrel domain-containing protein [Clostridium sp. Cult3]
MDKDLEDVLVEEFKYIEKEIKTEDGECIGYVKDIVIDKLKGSIEGFIITEGVFEDILKGRNYMPLFENTKITEDSICIFKSMLNSIDKNNN